MSGELCSLHGSACTDESVHFAPHHDCLNLVHMYTSFISRQLPAFQCFPAFQRTTLKSWEWPGYEATCTLYLPLPRAMSWSPSEELRVKRVGSHCISCSEEKPRMAQLVKMAMKTIARITSNHTPMSFDLRECMIDKIDMIVSNQ